MVEKKLRAPDCERRNDHRATPPDGAVDHLAQLLHWIGLRVRAITISRLNNHIVRIANGLRVVHERIAIAAKIAGEDNGLAAPTHFDCCGAENMAGAP